MAMEEKDKSRVATLASFGVGTAFGTVMGALMAAKPAQAAPTEDKLNYLIDVLTALVQVLGTVSDDQETLIHLFQQWLATQGVPVVSPGVPGVPGVSVTILTPWVAKDPEQILTAAITTAGTFYTDKMIDCRNVKRILFKAESSLNQPVQLQVIGDIVDDKTKATDIGPPVACPANGNASIGLAWDDWQPYVGVKISVAVAPTAGIITIWAVVQE